MIYKTIPKSVIERIPIYLNYLNKIDEDGLISSTTIAQQLGLGEVQVRKDLNLISGKGKPKVGYQVSNLKSDLNKLIFDDKLINVVIIGAGKIGSALAKYHGFNENSFKIVGIFDNSPEKIGRTINDKKTLSIDEMSSFCLTNDVKMAIICVPHDSAQSVCDEIINCGVKGILNFTDQKLNIPNDVKIRNVDIVSLLITLAVEINNN